MTKTKKILAIIMSSIFLVTFAIVGIIFLVKNDKRNHTPTTIMTCSLNPSIQMIINDNNKVMSVRAINSDGQLLIANAEFEGLSIDKAAELFVSLSIDTGYLEPAIDTQNGKVVNFELTGSLSDYNDLQEFIDQKVNDFFEQKGIVAVSITNATNTIEKTIQDILPMIDKSELDTDKELIDKLYYAFKDLEGTLISDHPNLVQYYNHELEKVNKYKNINSSNFQSLATIIDNFSSQLRFILNNNETAIGAFENILTLHNSLTIDQLKTSINSAKNSLRNIPSMVKDIAYQIISDAEDILNQAQMQYNNAQKEFETNYSNYLNELRNNASSTFENLEDEFEELVANNQAKIEAHNEFVQHNKQELQTIIKEYQDNYKK